VLTATGPTVLRVTREAMGTEFQIVLSGDDERALESAASYALDEVERLDRQMSLYDPRSELSWVNAHAAEGPVKVEPGLYRVLECAQRVCEETDGAFDVTVAPLVRLWRAYRRQGTVPPQSEIDRALALVGMEHVQLDPRGKTVRFDRPGVALDLGGIAKGYAVDRVAQLLRESGVRSALIHGGWSTVFALGRTPDREPWRIGIRHPRDAERRMGTVDLADAALSTSGSYESFFEVEGVVYSHIVDPRTGWPVQGMLSASVVSATALDGDALSTAFFVMGERKTRTCCSTRPEIGAILVPDPGRDVEPEAVRIGLVQ
jgi:thiamine biosynthesis lipoprotein